MKDLASFAKLMVVSKKTREYGNGKKFGLLWPIISTIGFFIIPCLKEHALSFHHMHI